MNNPTLLVTGLLLMLMWFCIGLYWGYRYAYHRHQSVPPKVIRAWLETTMPTEWAAYQHGILEGYAQGLRDGQEMPE